MSHSKRRSHKDVSKKRPLIIGLGLSLGLIVLAGLGYAYQANTYQSHFLPNTYIGDLNVSRLTADEVNQKLNKTYDDLSFTLLVNDQEWQSIKKTEFGLHTDVSEELTQL